MAGIAALMSRSRKEREKKRNASLQNDETAFSEVIPGKGKDGATLTPESKAKKSPVSLPRSTPSRESLSAIRKRNSKFDSIEDGSFGGGLRQSYTTVYIGLVLSAIGLVISFVGLGEKGFKTIELKLIGPILCIIGFLCIFLKILQCTFPRLLSCPRWLRRARLADSDKTNLMENGRKNGHLGNTNNPEGLSPGRVTLQSSRKVPRPPSTIPNYIEDSSEDDDFDAGRSRPHSNRNNSLEPKNEILLTPANLVL